MAVIYAENFSAGNSLFTSMNTYIRATHGVDPLYPHMRHAEFVTVTGGSRLDFNGDGGSSPQFAGIWIKGAGSLNGGGPGDYGIDGFWSAQQGCIECLYYPTQAALDEEPYSQLLCIASPTGAPALGFDVDVFSNELIVNRSVGGGSSFVTVLGTPPMPVAGVAYLVRFEWQCGTYDPDLETVAADGFVRVSINGTNIYDESDIALRVTLTSDPVNLADGAQFGFAGLIGELDTFTIRDTLCVDEPPLTGVVSWPLPWAKIVARVEPE